MTEIMGKIGVSKPTLQNLLLNNFRYCLGRMTHIVQECVEALIDLWWCLPDSYKVQIHEDIKKAIERGFIGTELDIEEWNKVLALPLSDEGKDKGRILKFNK